MEDRVVAEYLAELDSQLFFLVNNGLGRPWLDSLFRFLTWMGAWPIGFVALGALSFADRRRLMRRHLLLLLVGGVLASMLNRGIKQAVSAPRPGQVYEEELVEGTVTIRFLEKTVPMRKSYPSGHAMTAFYFMTYLSLAHRRFSWWALPAAALVALSRVYVGAHFPFDCLAGAIVGSVTAWLIWRVQRMLPPMAEALT